MINGFSGGTVIKNPPSNAGDARDVGLITRIGRSPRERNGNPLQYSCLENAMDRGASQATVHSITQSGAQLKPLSIHACTYLINHNSKPVWFIKK